MNNKQAEKEVRKTILVTIASKKTKTKTKNPRTKFS
jgi:hypothetical protein